MRQKDTYGTQRLLRDLAATGLMLQERPSAAERLDALLGTELHGVLRATLTGTPSPAHQHHRAA
jgi:hypothetical protein